MALTSLMIQIGQYPFVHVCAIEPTRGTNGALAEVMPQARYTNARGLPLNPYGAGPFCKFKVPRQYRNSGVYAINVSDTLQYIGKCDDLSARYNMGYGTISPRNCFKGGQETNCRLNNLIFQSAQVGHVIDLWFHATSNQHQIERELITAFRPTWNRA